MSEEIKVETKEQCLCKNEFFRKFLVISLGTFTGAFCALSLFSALNKPPMPHPYAFHKYHKMHHGIMKDDRCDCGCHKKHKKHHEDFKKQHKSLEQKEIDD